MFAPSPRSPLFSLLSFLWFSFSSPPPWCAIGACPLLMAQQVQVNADDKSYTKLGTGKISGLDFYIYIYKESLLSFPLALPGWLGWFSCRRAQTLMPTRTMEAWQPHINTATIISKGSCQAGTSTSGYIFSFFFFFRNSQIHRFERKIL